MSLDPIKMRSMGWAVLLSFLLPLSALAQDTTLGLNMDVDKRQVEVGEHVTVTLEFRQAGSGNVAKEPQIPTSENFVIRGHRNFTQITMVGQQSNAIATTKLDLEATKTGTATLGPALVIYQDTRGRKKELKSNVVTVTVVEKSDFALFGKKKSVPTPPVNPAPTASNDEELRGLKPLMPDHSIFFVALLVVVVLLIIGFVWRQLAKGPRASAPPPVPGKAAQLREIWKKLGKEDLDSKEFCLGLSNLVRECLQYRYSFEATHSTTEEILKQMAGSKASEDDKAAAEKILKSCDRVLHADGNLTGRDNLRTLCSALLPKVQKG